MEAIRVQRVDLRIFGQVDVATYQYGQARPGLRHGRVDWADRTVLVGLARLLPWRERGESRWAVAS